MSDYKIGRYLKIERKNRNLTQKEFLQGVLSVSQYSRIESEEQDIKVSDFIRILLLNKINFTQFFNRYLDDSDMLDSNKSLEKIAQLFYNGDLSQINKMKSLVKDDKLLTLETKVIVAILEGNIKDLDENVKEEISNELNKKDDWTRNKEFLQLFSSSMQIFSIERLNIYMKKILREYKDTISKESYEVQRRIASVCINYLGRAYNSTDTVVDDIIIFLKNLSENTDLLMYKMLRLYFVYLRQNNQEKMNDILSLLREVGYSQFIRNLPKNCKYTNFDTNKYF